tara:strand:- start:2049 stop:2783 length:735 start_codon:yes stop_codon:yes gene_type:complete
MNTIKEPIQLKLTGKFMTVGCSHGNLIDPVAEKAFFKHLRAYKPKHVFHLGDAFEFTALRKGATEDEKRIDIEADIEAGLKFLDKLFRNIKGEKWLLRGNHCERLWEMAANGTVIGRDFAQHHIDRIESFLKKRDIKMKPYCSYSGILQVNDVLLMHGYGFGVNAAKDHMKLYHLACIFNHTHRAETAIGTGWPHALESINGGMLMKKQPKYASRTTSVLSWTHACVEGTFEKDGTHTKNLVTL